MGSHCHNVQSDRLGTNLVALAAIDLAAWDLYSKSLRVTSCFRRWGRPSPNSSLWERWIHGRSKRPQKRRMSQRDTPERGFTGRQALVLRATFGAIPRSLKPFERAVGDGATMMVDANERCDLAGAKQLLLLARDHDVAFVEEPLPAHALSALSRACKVLSCRDRHRQSTCRLSQISCPT